MPVGYTDIVGKFTRAVVDGPDSDRDPDRIPIEGLQFEFVVDLKPAIARDTVAKETVYLDPIPATTDANGVLIGPDGLPGIRLTASDSPDLEPNGWTYTVTTKGAGLPTVKTTFVTESGKTLDFSDIVAVPPNPGNQIPAWTAVVSQATTAAAEATEAKTVAVAAAESVQRDQPNGVAPLGADAKIPDAKLPARLADSALTAKIGDELATPDTPARMAADAVYAAARLGTRQSPILTRKLRGANIVPKPGHDWPHLFAEWDWDNWIRPQIDRAIALGLNAIRLIGAARVVFENPTGSSLLKITQAQYDQRWSQVAAYCLVNGLYLYPCIASKWDYTVVSSYQNATRTAAIKTTAAVLAGYSNVIGFDVFQEGDAFTGVPWKQNTAYPLGYIVNNAGNSFKVTTAGTSVTSGSGPTATSGSVTDGSVTWAAQGKTLMVADVLALMQAIREVANVPLTMSRSIADGFGWNDTTSMWYQVFNATNGADFVDLHLYADGVLPGDPDFLLLKTGKPVLIGEYGANQSLTSTARTARYNAAAAIHNRRGVIGSFAWGLADQKSSSNPEDQWGLFDNTGFVDGVSPLSTTAGKRTSLTDVIPKLTVADRLESAYRPPNVLSAIQARPRNVGTPAASGWRIGNNTYLYSEARGLGFGATAAGTTLVSTEVGSDPVTPATYYRASVTFLAGTVGRAVAMNVDWYDSAGAYLVSSVSATGTDSPTIPLTLALVVRSHVSAAYGVIVARVTDSGQPLNEGHIVMDAELVPTA